MATTSLAKKLELDNQIDLQIGPSARVNRLRARYLTYKPNACIERARIITDFFKTEVDPRDPLIIQRAKAFRQILFQRSIYIAEDEIVVGSLASRPRGFPAYPDTTGDLFKNEYAGISCRWPDPIDLDPRDEEELVHHILPFWKGRSLHEAIFQTMSSEEKNLFFLQPGDDFLKGTNIFTLDVPLFGPGGHITPDYQTVLEIGFLGIKQKAMRRLDLLENQQNRSARDFLQAVCICCDAVTAFGKRYADLARKLAREEGNRQRRKELLTIASTCEQVPGGPARNFREAVQSVWFTYLCILMEAYQRCYSLGRMDQYLYKYYQADLADGSLRPEEAQEILDCLWLKLAETNYINSRYYSLVASGFPVQQQIPVGGQTPEGEDATNSLTYMCIQASMNTRLHQPSLSVRLWRKSPEQLYRKACELARMGTGHPSFFNDEVVVPALVRKGVALEDARDYSSVGCAGAQPTRKDKGAHNAGYINVAAALELALTNGYWRFGQKRVGLRTGEAEYFTSFDQFMEAFAGQLGYLIDTFYQVSCRVEKIHQEVIPTPYLSSFVGGCIERAKDRTAGGADYNFGITPRAVGLADVVDSLVAIKKLVFEDQVITMKQLLEALEKNFEGSESLRQILINHAPKYGNDDDYADSIAQQVVDLYVRASEKHKSYFGGDFHPGFAPVSANVPYGKVIGALPNGRKAGEPLADGIAPCHNADRAGPTAMALSCSKLDHQGMSGGSILNVKFNPAMLQGEKGLARLVAYVKTLVNLGVWHVQFNVVDGATLRDAQLRPEKYPDLLVRVAGYSAFFTHLSKQLQDDIIDRTEHSLN